MTSRVCEDFVQQLNLHDEEPLWRPRLSIQDRKAKREMFLAKIRERIRLKKLHAPLRPRFCPERNKDLELLTKHKMHRERIRDAQEKDVLDRLFPSKTTVKSLTPDERQQLRDMRRKLVEAQEAAVDKLYEEDDQDNREILYASLRDFHTTSRALAQLEADAYSVI